MNPLLSLVIPTRNRYRYLKSLLAIMHESASANVELVIQDNSNAQSLDFLEDLKSAADLRVKYYFDPSPKSVVDNCDFAIDKASGDYVCMLGDDDAFVLKDVLTVAEFAKSTLADAVVVNKASYYWPDTRHAVWNDSLSGKIFYSRYSSRARRVDPISELRRVLRRGAASSLEKMPRVYHGLVKRELLNDLRSSLGTCFPGPSPDMANAVALSLFSRDVYYIDWPAIISGHCSKSTGGLGGSRLHQGRLEEQNHLPVSTALVWDKSVPKYWSGPTIYAESASKALQIADPTLTVGKRLKLNYSFLYAYCLVFEPFHRAATLTASLQTPMRLILVPYYILLITLFRFVNFFLNLARYRLGFVRSSYCSDTFFAQASLGESLGSFTLLES